MMQLFNYIGILILAIILSADTCETATDKAKRQSNQEAQQIAFIAASMQSDDLSENAREAFEIKARQKLLEFAEYYSLYSDKRLHDEFRMTALTLLNHLFKSDTNLITIHLDQRPSSGEIRLSQLPEVVSQHERQIVGLRIDSIQNSGSLKRNSENAWSNDMQFTYMTYSVDGQDTTTIAHTTGRCTYVIKKVEKHFGAQSGDYWQLLLTGITPA